MRAYAQALGLLVVLQMISQQFCLTLTCVSAHEDVSMSTIQRLLKFCQIEMLNRNGDSVNATNKHTWCTKFSSPILHDLIGIT